MEFNLDNFNKITTSLVGEELASISNHQFFYNGIACMDDIGQVELVFLSGKTVCLNLGSDGESITIRSGGFKVSTAFEMSETEKFSWKKMNLDKTSLFIGKEIISVSHMIVHYIDKKIDWLSGLKVIFSDQSYFVYYNCGDDAKFLVNELPPLVNSGYEERWE